MTNREYLDYLKVCTNRNIPHLPVSLLDSEVSIKDYINEFDKLEGLGEDIEFRLLKALFKNNSDIEETLKIVCRLFKNYRRYLDSKEYKKLIFNLFSDIEYSWGSSTLSICKKASTVRDIKKIGDFSIEGTQYVNGFKVFWLRDKISEINSIGVIVCKDGAIRLYTRINKEAERIIEDIMEREDYDLIILPR